MDAMAEGLLGDAAFARCYPTGNEAMPPAMTAACICHIQHRLRHDVLFCQIPALTARVSKILKSDKWYWQGLGLFVHGGGVISIELVLEIPSRVGALPMRGLFAPSQLRS